MKNQHVAIIVDLSDYRSHVFNVTMHIAKAVPMQRLSMPVWTPGSYLVREFAQHLIAFEAFEMGEKISYKKINKNTFEINNSGADVLIKYQIYGFDSSIRAAFIDDQQAFFNGTALFLCPKGLENDSFSLTIIPAQKEKWLVATTMPKVKVDSLGFGTYGAESYEELVDYPVQISPMRRLGFSVKTIPHEIVLVGDVRPFDEQRLIHDLTSLCTEHIKLFGEAPFREYMFIARFEEGGYGGLEHRNSTMLLSAPNVLPKIAGEPDANYRSFLALCSHEYFHAWNIKAIKPKEFVPYDLDQECYTDLLWIFEGITSYYDDLLVRRAGLISQESYLDVLSKNLTKLKRNHGRRIQSLCDSSFDAWIKFYRPNENSLNSGTSYYLKGSIVALYLDLVIRSQTKGEKSLDDIMRAAFIAYGDGHGMLERQFLALLEQIGTLNVNEIKERFLIGTEDTPLETLLDYFGVELRMEPDETFVDERTRMFSHVGFKLRFDDNQRALISFVESNSPAMHAGLSANDEIIAINGIRLDPLSWPDIASGLKPNKQVELFYARKKLMYQAQLMPSHILAHQCRLRLKAVLTGQDTLRASWLGK